MAPSLRKRHRVEGPDSPETTAPIVAAQPPAAVEKTEPPQPEPVESPVEQAARSALQDRLAEAERAESLARESSSQSRLASEPMQQVDPLEQAIAHLPERAQRWYRNDPTLASDPEKAARVHYCHHVAVRETGQEGGDLYLDRMEQMLGLAPKPAAPAPRNAPPRQPAAQSRQSFQAPPTRDAPSMSTGRPTSEPTRLTTEEMDLARTLGLTPEQYRKGKERMQREKAAGLHQDGR